MSIISWPPCWEPPCKWPFRFLVVYCLWCWETDWLDKSSNRSVTVNSVRLNFLWNAPNPTRPGEPMCFHWIKSFELCLEWKFTRTSRSILITGKVCLAVECNDQTFPGCIWCFSTADWKQFLANVNTRGLWDEPLLSLGWAISTSHRTVMQDDSKSVSARCKMSYISE